MIKTKQFCWLTHLNTSADYPGLHKHYIYPLLPSPAHLLPLTGSVRRVVHRELGFNTWKKIWVYPSVPVNLQPWTARCGDHYDPQPVKRSSEWVSYTSYSDVKSSRPKWPRGQNFGLGLCLKALASNLASNIWPRPGLSLSYYVIGHFSGKNRVKFRNFVNFFPAIILNHMLLIIIWYTFS